MTAETDARFQIPGNSGNLANRRPVRSALTQDERHAQVVYTDCADLNSLEFVPTSTGSHQWTQRAARERAEAASDPGEIKFFSELARRLKPLDGPAA